ncbi:hypothetical protein GCM10009638_23240 [Luteococcus sanguinis]
MRVEVVEFGAQELVASGQAAQGSQGGGVGQVVDLVRASGGQQVDELVTAQITVLVTQPGAGVDQDGADLAPAGLEDLLALRRVTTRARRDSIVSRLGWVVASPEITERAAR